MRRTVDPDVVWYGVVLAVLVSGLLWALAFWVVMVA